MRIPFPVRVSLLYVTCFAVVLFVVQIAEGTSPVFAIFSLLFVMLSGVTFNMAGGFSTSTGFYVSSYAILAVILGITWKAVLGEPGNSNLSQPELTMKVYAGSMAAMLVAVAISRRITVKKPLLGSLITDANMQGAVAGSLLTGIVLTIYIMLAGERAAGSAVGILAQLNGFLPLAIILGTLYEIRRSGGTRSVNLASLIAMVAVTALGVIAFSKAGMFVGPLCWIIVVSSQGYRLSRAQVVGLIFAVYLAGHYMVPFSQFGRNYGEPTLSGKVDAAVELLGRLGEVRELALAQTQDDDRTKYFNTSQGIMDRLQMIFPDDALISITEERGPIGIFPLIIGVENLVPHVIWPDKPIPRFGNYYAHEMGGLADDDDTTGISFSPSGEAYHIAGWIGIFVWAPLLWIMLFTVFDSLCGDPRVHPWGLLMASFYVHMAPEGMLQSIIHAIGFYSLVVAGSAVVTAYLMPVIGALISSSRRSTLLRTGLVRGTFRQGPNPLTQQGVGQ